MRDDIECPADIMMKHVVPALDQLLQDSRICLDEVNNIIMTRMVPVELAHSIGLIAMNTDQQSSSASYANTPPSGLNLTISQNPSSQNIPNIAASPTSISGNASPCSFYNSPSCGNNGGSSPIHQITKSLSGLTTGGGGSITLGTSSISTCDRIINHHESSSEPLDLSMDVTIGNFPGKDVISATMTTGWQVPSIFNDSNQITLSPVQQLRVVPTPPTSPNLCIIQEEMHIGPSADVRSMVVGAAVVDQQQSSTSSGVS